MNILIIANYNENKGGISGVVKNHFNKLREDGNNVHLFNTKVSTFCRFFLIFPLFFKMRKYTIVHIHSCSYWGFYPVVLGVFVSKVIYNKKTIVTYHGGGAEDFLAKHLEFIRYILGKVDHITVMSGFLQNIFHKFSIPTVILRNLVDLELNKLTPQNIEVPTMVSVRTLSHDYNIVDILLAFKLIKAKHKKASLAVIGDGPEYDDLVNFCTQEKLVDVKFLGVITNEEIQDELKKYNIMISVPSFDNQPMSILEAFAAGLAVISSNVGGIPFMIRNEQNGLLVDLHNPQQIYERVDWLVSNPDQVKIIIENAKRDVMEYQWETIREKLYNIYIN